MGSLKVLMPMFDRVLVQRLLKSPKTTAGIHLPEDKARIVSEGIVVSVGPGKRDPETGDFIPVEINEGDVVLVPENGGYPVDIENKEYLLFSEADILAKIYTKN